VDERTRDVEGTNRVLRQEILQHQRARGELEASQAQLRTLAAHMESVREEEATRIAREVHDVLGQMLTSIKLDVSWLQRHVEAEGSVRRQR
jgi:signal transduction histidine kinase